jgi:hypothetical protein
MDILHFTPGSLDPDNVRHHGTSVHMPLASGNGDFEISCLYLAPGSQIAIPPGRHAQLLLVVNGKFETAFTLGPRLDPAFARQLSVIVDLVGMDGPPPAFTEIE